MEQLDSHWTDFRKILHLGNFRKSVEKIQFHENPTRITGALREDQYTFFIISRSVFLEREMFETKFVEKIKTRILCSTIFFRKSVYEMEKNTVEPGRPQMTTWCMCISCWIPKAKNTPSECVILIAFPLKHWLHESLSCPVFTVCSTTCAKLRECVLFWFVFYATF